MSTPENYSFKGSFIEFLNKSRRIVLVIYIFDNGSFFRRGFFLLLSFSLQNYVKYD